jgi:cytosine/adenosine deaminase-related metal-dependent hydrolase
MAFITAQQIHDGRKWLPAGSVIETTADGAIVAIHDKATADTVFYEGVLAPGFVNAHCHLELSHMKGLVPEHTGLVPFLKEIPLHRNDFSIEEKLTARHNAYRELIANGIVAVGDIANTTDSLDLRALDAMHIHTFIESIGFTEANAAKAFDFALQAYNAYNTQPVKEKLLRQTIAPHAPYSVSPALFRMIGAHGNGAMLSIHNQESEEENKFYISKEGAINSLLQALNVEAGFFQPSGRSSLQTYLGWVSADKPVIFVHNTYTKLEDVRFALQRSGQAFWCLCPNANLYIENRLPDIDMLINEGVTICVGTDSLASNHGLSIISELATIKQHYPALPWETLLRWGTCNGAEALQMGEKLGAIAPGKKPGIVQLSGLENGFKPSVKRII